MEGPEWLTFKPQWSEALTIYRTTRDWVMNEHERPSFVYVAEQPSVCIEVPEAEAWVLGSAGPDGRVAAIEQWLFVGPYWYSQYSGSMQCRDPVTQKFSESISKADNKMKGNI